MNGIIVLVFCYCIVVFQSYGWNFSNSMYINCPGPESCKNPFYVNPDPIECPEGQLCLQGNYNPNDYGVDKRIIKLREKCNEDWCSIEMLPPGFEAGKKPSRLFTFADEFAIMVSCFGFIINHLLYNRKFKFRGVENKK